MSPVAGKAGALTDHCVECCMYVAFDHAKTVDVGIPTN